MEEETFSFTINFMDYLNRVFDDLQTYFEFLQNE